jgi:hypothetical protein
VPPAVEAGDACAPGERETNCTRGENDDQQQAGARGGPVGDDVARHPSFNCGTTCATMSIE